MASGIEAGTVSYLVSSKWMKRYHEFILFDQFKQEVTENDLQVDVDHFAKNYPGPISNEQDLLEEDKDAINLYGTGTMKDMESEYIDRYVEQGCQPQ